MATNVLRVQFHSDRTIEDTVAEVMAECRRRAGMSKARFARAINDGSSYNPGLMDASIDAFEGGRAVPGADVLCRAMRLAGQDVVGRLTAWVTGPSASPSPPSVVPRHASGPR